MHQAALVAFNKMVAKHRENLIHYRKAMAAFILKTEVPPLPPLVLLNFCVRFLRSLQNAVDLEVAKLHLTDHTSINSAASRSMIRRRLFASTIPMRPWFPLSIAAPDLKTMLQDSLITQRKIVSLSQMSFSFITYFLMSCEKQNRQIKPNVGILSGIELDGTKNFKLGP